MLEWQSVTDSDCCWSQCLPQPDSDHCCSFSNIFSAWNIFEDWNIFVILEWCWPWSLWWQLSLFTGQYSYPLLRWDSLRSLINTQILVTHTDHNQGVFLEAEKLFLFWSSQCGAIDRSTVISEFLSLRWRTTSTFDDSLQMHRCWCNLLNSQE